MNCPEESIFPEYLFSDITTQGVDVAMIQARMIASLFVEIITEENFWKTDCLYCLRLFSTVQGVP